ncbi:acyltransferase family protein [Acinetobacter sp. YH12238]|uniref:acyltransferase family protein n=1 Tax=Acinetobacter sp. YH12238 TaxID=2601165 RepID=UPI0015D2EEA9
MRDNFIDTSKGLLIFLVVVGHFLEELIGWTNNETRAILGTIYSFHMPAFIFISGMFFKDKDIIKKVLYFFSILVPFHILYVLVTWLIKGDISKVWLIQPYWMMWYLAGMIAWTLLTPLLKKTGYPVVISILLSVVIGLSPISNYYFSLGRIFVFLPFFVIGSIYGQQIVAKIKSIKALVYVAAFVFIVLACFFYNYEITRQWLYGSFNYNQLSVTPYMGIITRLMIFAVSCVAVCSFLSISTIFKDKFVALGRNTLPVYLLHGFVVIIFVNTMSFNGSYILLIFISLFSAVLTSWVLRQNLFEVGIKVMADKIASLIIR